MSKTKTKKQGARAPVVKAAITDLTLTERLDLEKTRLSAEAAAAPDRIQGVQNRIFERALHTIEAALSFADVEFDEEGRPMGIPQAWIDEEGEVKAKKRYRAMLKGQENSQNAPVVMKMAVDVANTIIRARATEKSAPVSINVERAVLQVAPTVYPEQIVDVIQEDGDDY